MNQVSNTAEIKVSNRVRVMMKVHETVLRTSIGLPKNGRAERTGNVLMNLSSSVPLRPNPLLPLQPPYVHRQPRPVRS